MSGHHHGPDHGSPENPWAGRGSVLLDIGEEIGALVVHMPRSWIGREVEARPVTTGGRPPTSYDGPAQHVAVVDRAAPGGRVPSVPSLVFGALAAGRYRLAEVGSDQADCEVLVTGGEVTETTWPVP